MMPDALFPLSRSLFHERYRTVAEDKIVAMLKLAGWAYERDDPNIEPRARAALQRWVDLGLPCRISDQDERLFDPAEVWATMKRLGREGDPYLLDHYTATGRRLVSDLAASATPNGPFSFEIHRTFHLSGALSGRPLRLRLPLPLEQFHGQRSVELLGQGSDPNAAVVLANRIELRHAGVGGPVTWAARLGFSAPLDQATGENRDIYLRPRDGAVVVSKRVHDLALGLAGQGSTVAQAVRGFWIFMIERFTCIPIHYDQIDPAAPCDRVLDTGAYDCRLGAALFVALCRARGIPARIVGGYVLYRRAPTHHFWAEYWCSEAGWTPVDFLGWDLSGGGDDPIWRDRFFGQIDARLVTELLPLAFTGAPGVPIPERWHLLQTATGDGVEIALTGLDGRPVYSDLIRLLDN